ncbi:MAG: response regulator [Chloroflexi bacterium]|nr:MAG: response regulator [Chloroflexota bacterium]
MVGKMENFWIWLIIVGGIVVTGLLAYWWRRSAVHLDEPSAEAIAPATPVHEIAQVETPVVKETAVTPPPIPTIPDNPEGTPWRILVVDDMSIWAETIRQFSTLFNCKVRHAARVGAAVQELARWKPHLILLDLHMPRDPWQPIAALQGKYSSDYKTLAFCEQVTSHPKLSHILVAITSVEEQAEQQAFALSAGAHHFFTKGEFNVEQFSLLLTEVAKRNPAAIPSSPTLG